MKISTPNLKVIWFFLSPYKLQFLGLFCIGVLMAIFDIINIALLYPILAMSTNQTSHTDNLIYNFIYSLNDLCAYFIPVNDPLITSCILFIFFAVLSFVFGIIYVLYSLHITSMITTENKKRIFEKILHSDYQFFVDNKQGDITYKTLRAPSFISEVFNNIAKLSIDIILSISTLVLLVSISLTGSLVLFLAGGGYYLLTRYLSQKISYITGTGRYKLGQQENVLLNESITGIKQIKVYEVPGFWKMQFGKITDEFYALWRKDSFWIQVPSLLLYLLIFITIGGVIIIIKLFYPFDFILYLPILGTFSLAVLKILPRLANFGNYQMAVMSALPNLKVVEDILTDTTYVSIKNGTIRFNPQKPDMIFNHVTFSHHGREQIFSDLTLHIEAGKTTAIVGHSGSGKSTLIDLILRLYDVDSGAILIDNINIQEYNLESMREKIGFVSQETFIYNASIRENITFGKTYMDSEIIEASTLANAHTFIEQLPEKLDTIVGDRGIKLSGGERQRIAIARAIIRKPEILILDEATSSLDNVSEKVVQDAINNVAKKCTTIIVAHRLSTIKNADIIHVVEKGRIIESGSHEDLIVHKGKYYEMYITQKEYVQ